MEAMNNGNKLTNNKCKGVWTIVENEGGNKPRWVRLGTAFVNRDSSMNVYLEAAPKSFKLHIRDLEPEHTAASN